MFLNPRSTFYVGAEVVADLPQDEVDVVLPRDGVSRHAGGGVGRPSYGHLLPGQEEDDASVTRRWIQKTHVVRTVGGEQLLMKYVKAEWLPTSS